MTLHSDNMLQYVLSIWTGGGWLMIPLAVLALILYFCVLELLRFVNRYKFQGADANEWKHWVQRPQDGSGLLGDVIAFSQSEVDGLDDIRGRIHELINLYISPIDRRIAFVGILVGAAPLTGLLGTVVGMLATFNGLSAGTGGGTAGLVAGGISQALITTQTGLVIAIPAYVLLNKIRNRRNELESFFLQLEIETINNYARTHAAGREAGI